VSDNAVSFTRDCGTGVQTGSRCNNIMKDGHKITSCECSENRCNGASVTAASTVFAVAAATIVAIANRNSFF
jgi:hypothetical protein